MKELVFIINPKAGTDQKKNVIGKIEKFAGEDHGFNSRIMITKFKNQATELAAEAVSNNTNIVVAVGGDGTVNEVASGLKNSKSVLGIIPCGSGNGLARHFRLPMDTSEALKILENGKIKVIDSMLVNDRFSLNISGVGFDAHVAALFASYGKRGLATYAKIAIKAFSDYKPGEYTINFNNQVIRKKAFLVVFANGTQWGNNAIIAPIAMPDDSKITLGIVEKLNLATVSSFVLRLFNGSLNKWKGMNFYEAESIHLESDFDFPLHIDGETAGYMKKVNIKIQPESIKIIVPEVN